ncbi:MAG: hypothetical protein GX825_01550, partial [Syntrophomonadaceae bacterium]|nr:hypothetical protein [Syntrophomonadaceae bacterium]
MQFYVWSWGWIKSSLSYGDINASQPGIASFQLDRFSLGPLTATAKITLEPPEAGSLEYNVSGNNFYYLWQPFLGTERFPVEKHQAFNAVAKEGYIVKEWQRYDYETEDFVYFSNNATTTFYIDEEDEDDPLVNSYKVIFAEAVNVRVSSGAEGHFPTPWQGYSQDAYENGAPAAKGRTLKFYVEGYGGWAFTHWSDGNTENDREILCDQDIDLVANYKKVLRVNPSAYITNAEWDAAISIEGDIGEFEPDENGEVTCTITLDYPENYHLADWFFYLNGVKDHSIEGNSLTATLIWGEINNFSPVARFVKKTQLQVLPAEGQEERGSLEVRHNNSEGEEIVLDANGNAYLDIGSNIWLKASPADLNRFTHWNCKYGNLDYNNNDAEFSLTLTDNPSHNFTAYFVSQGFLNLQIAQDSNGDGTFKVDYQDYVANAIYDVGTRLYIQATPGANSRFDKWLDNPAALASRYINIGIGENTYTARFVKIGSIVLKAEIVDNGEPGGGVAKTYALDIGEQMTLNAVPLSGYSLYVVF